MATSSTVEYCVLVNHHLSSDRATIVGDYQYYYLSLCREKIPDRESDV